MTPAEISDELRRASDDFQQLIDNATTADLRKRSNGTRWTNDQLLFHETECRSRPVMHISWRNRDAHHPSEHKHRQRIA